MHLSPHEQERLLLSYAAELARRRRARGDLVDAAVLTVAERVLLGRTGEEAGRWTGATRIEWAGWPLLHTTIGRGAGQPAWLPPVASRAYASTVHIADDEAQVATGEDAVRLPVPGRWQTTAWGPELHGVVRAVEELEPRGAVRVPA